MMITSFLIQKPYQYRSLCWLIAGQHFQRFCVYNGFALARDGEHGLQPEDIDPFLCTHIIFSFAEVDETGTRLKDPDHFEAKYLYDVTKSRFLGLNKPNKIQTIVNIICIIS